MTRPLGSEQTKALEWIARRGGSVVAPKGDRVLRSLCARGLVTRSATADVPTDRDLADFGMVDRRGYRRGAWYRWTLTQQEDDPR